MLKKQNLAIKMLLMYSNFPYTRRSFSQSKSYFTRAVTSNEENDLVTFYCPKVKQNSSYNRGPNFYESGEFLLYLIVAVISKSKVSQHSLNICVEIC